MPLHWFRGRDSFVRGRAAVQGVARIAAIYWLSLPHSSVHC